MGPCREHVRVLGSDALGARASGPHRAEGPQGADRSDTPEPATPPPEVLALGAMGSPGSAGAPSACPCGGPVARYGRDARAPRDGTRASLADPAPQGHSKLSARRLMGPCREHVRVLGSDALGARASGPAPGRRPARRRQERHARGRPHPRPRRGPGSDALGARASGPHRAEGPQSADKNDTPEPATPPPEAWPRERCPGSAGLWPASGRRPARRRQERHARAGHTPARGVALGAMGSPGSAGVPSACPCGGPAARLRAGRPRSQGRHPSVTRRPCAAGPFQALGEEVDGSVSGTCSCTWERCPGSAGIMPASGRRPARRRQERHARAGHTPARGVALGAMGSPGSAGVPSACPCGGPVARCGRDARAPRDGTRASLADPAPHGKLQTLGEAVDGSVSGTCSCTWERCPGSAGVPSACPCGGPAARCGRDARAPGDGTRASLADPAPQGHSKLSARRLMGPCREHVHGLRQGTSLWPVTRFSPGERESNGASSIRGNPMNLGTRPPA